MGGGVVITDHEQKLKIGHVHDQEVMPRFPTIIQIVGKYLFAIAARL